MSGFSVQIGSSTSNTSRGPMSETSRAPNRGSTCRSRELIQILADLAFVQPALWFPHTILAASAKVGTPGRRFRGNGIVPGRNHTPVLKRAITRHLERHDRVATESERAASAAKRDPLLPTLRATRVDSQMQPLTVVVLPRPAHRIHEFGRQLCPQFHDSRPLQSPPQHGGESGVSCRTGQESAVPLE